MAIDKEKLKEFYAKMYYEGGLEGMIRYGIDGTGDDKLDRLGEEIEAIMDEWDARWNELLKEHPDLEEWEEEF